MPNLNMPAEAVAAVAALPERWSERNPLWAGPSAAGPRGGVTQSMLGRFTVCRDRFRLKYLLGLESADRWDKSFGYGNMWHVCEEALAAGDVRDQGIAHWPTALDQHVGGLFERYPMQRQEIEKWWNVC